MQTTTQGTKGIQQEINRYLLSHGRLPHVNLGIAVIGATGSCSPEELLYLADTVRRTDAHIVGEVGFNIGYSSYALLSAHPDVRVVSFDISRRASLKAAKRFIDKKFPNRHTLIQGNSRKTIPEFGSRNPDLRFDVVFIDGGHDYESAKADIMNMKSLSTEKTAVVIDDLNPWKSRHVAGVARAWTEAIRDGVIVQDELIKDGKPAAVIEPPGDTSWALGRYVFG